MSSKRLIISADTHTQGEPTRLVIGGVIHYPGKTMREKQTFAARELDSIRKSLMSEPLGHQDMYGGFITPPATDKGDLGILFMDNTGFMDMCGHGTIGLCTTVVELGLIEATPPRTEIQIDTPAGRVHGFAISQDGKVIRVGFQNVPSFCTNVCEQVAVDGIGNLEVGIAYGGNFFAILPAKAAGVDIEIRNMHAIREVGMKIKKAVNQQLDVKHPNLEEVSGVNIITFYGPSDNPQATYKNVHIFSGGQIDRSPGGTGTSAMLAYLTAKGDLNRHESATAEGLAGGLFGGKIVKTWQENGMTKHIPEISGAAFITGIHHFTLNTDDPMVEGIHPR